MACFIKRCLMAFVVFSVFPPVVKVPCSLFSTRPVVAASVLIRQLLLASRSLSITYAA
jgi:hypothetical protein